MNQYVSRDVPGYVQTLGTASASANVSLWSTNSAYALASRKGTYFRAELPVNNANGPVWAQLTNLALLPGGSSADVLSSAAGNLFVPKTPEQFTYDPDGNLLTDGRWTYTWDAENRLIDMTSLSGAPAGSKLKLDFTYDYKGRRIQKVVSTWNGSAYVVQSDRTRLFVYDGWNLLAVLTSPSSVVQSFVWGLDLSGTEQGAGGVGGLLLVSDTANGVHFAAFDGNGNVAGLVKAVDGTSSAVYEYGPFGEVIRATGPMARANPFRFSSKYQDDETDLLYYGYRYYNASTGRWIQQFRKVGCAAALLSEAQIFVGAERCRDGGAAGQSPRETTPLPQSPSPPCCVGQFAKSNTPKALTQAVVSHRQTTNPKASPPPKPDPGHAPAL